MPTELIIKEEYEDTVQDIKCEEIEQSSCSALSCSCNLCEFSTVNSTDLQEHMEINHSDSKYSCNQCRYSTWDKQALMEHIVSDVCTTTSLVPGFLFYTFLFVTNSIIICTFQIILTPSWLNYIRLRKQFLEFQNFAETFSHVTFKKCKKTLLY